MSSDGGDDIKSKRTMLSIPRALICKTTGAKLDLHQRGSKAGRPAMSDQGTLPFPSPLESIAPLHLGRCVVCERLKGGFRVESVGLASAHTAGATCGGSKGTMH